MLNAGKTVVCINNSIFNDVKLLLRAGKIGILKHFPSKAVSLVRFSISRDNHVAGSMTHMLPLQIPIGWSERI